MPGPIGNAPLHNVAPQSAPTLSATPSGIAVRQEPAQEKRGFFSMFQKAQPAAAPASKTITARTVFSWFANIKMLATKGYTATTNALKKEQCLQELGSLGKQRADLVSNKAGGQEIRKVDDAIAERSKSITAKEWLQVFGARPGFASTASCAHLDARRHAGASPGRWFPASRNLAQRTANGPGSCPTSR